MLNMPTCTSRKQWKRTLSHDITSLSHQMAEQFKIMFCFPLGVGMGDIPCITLYTKKYGYSVKISSLLTNYIYINFFYIQNLRVNWCCLENRQRLCRYSKCSVKAWKLWMLKDTCSCQSYAVIEQLSLFCKQIKFFWLTVISLVVHLAVCCQGVLFWILRWNEHGLLDNLVFYLKGTI